MGVFLVLIGLSHIPSAVAAPPVNGDQICVSGAGIPAVNGTYTYNATGNYFENATNTKWIYYSGLEWRIVAASYTAYYYTTNYATGGGSAVNDMTDPALNGGAVWTTYASGVAPAPTGVNGTCAAALPVQPVPTPHFQVWGWNVAGSLADLVTQTGVQWWPGLTPPAHVGVAIDLGNPFSTGYTTGHIMRRPRAASSQPSSTEQP